MKITKQQLKQIIKEELENVLQEETPNYGTVVEDALSISGASAEDVVSYIIDNLNLPQLDLRRQNVEEELMNIVNHGLLSEKEIQDDLNKYINRNIYGATAYRR